MRLLQKKLVAGADFALTQPVYDAKLATTFLETYQARYGDLQLPILVGVLPLYSARHAAFLHHEVPGIQIPDPVRDRIEAAGENAPRVGIQVAIELLESLTESVQGVYLMPPFNRYDMAAEIIEAIRSRV